MDLTTNICMFYCRLDLIFLTVSKIILLKMNGQTYGNERCKWTRPIVNIRAIKPNKKQDSAITSAIKETAKYSVKSSDYLTDDLESNLKAVEDLERGLYAKRLISYGGALKTAH